MADEYYPPVEAEPASAERESSGAEENMGDTALLPKALFEDYCKEGDIERFEIVKIYDDEVEVRKVGKEKPKTEASPESQLDAMAREEY